ANDVATPESPYILRQGVALYTQRSLDGGRTWGDVRIIDPGEGVEVGQCCSRFVAGAMWTFNDKEWLAVGPDGTLLLVWTKFAMVHPENGLEQPLAARLLASTSEDGGLTWSSPRMIDGEGRPLGPSPVIGLDGVWRVTYTDIVGDILRFAESRDRGETWDIRTIGSTSWLAVMRTQTLASGIERLLLAYTTGGDSYSGQHQTELTWSDDGGAMWAPPLIVDPPEGEGHTMPDVVGAPGDSAWVTFFDLEGSDAAQHSRYLAVKVVNGVAGAPLVLDEMEMAAETLGNYMGLGVTPSGDAIVAWATGRDGQYDIAFARVRAGIGYVPGATDWALAQPGVPTGLDEPVAYEFNGHLDVAGCYAEVDPALEPFVRHEIEFEFDVPADTRYINGTLEWSTHGPPASPTDLDDLDVSFYDAEGDRWRGTDDVPETFEFELHEGDQGAWTALVYNCENMPTDFTLTLGLS
ncbi:MAG TPA: sialidase family protein, partial [Candidatus Thermoplasmatota archaeon]|nr:sialidase family protein [Candidatus Thermoplasmatota archaeon]